MFRDYFVPGDSVPRVMELHLFEQILFAVLAAPTVLRVFVKIECVVGDLGEFTIPYDLRSQILVQGAEQASPVVGALKLSPPGSYVAVCSGWNHSSVCSLKSQGRGWGSWTLMISCSVVSHHPSLSLYALSLSLSQFGVSLQRLGGFTLRMWRTSAKSIESKACQ